MLTKPFLEFSILFFSFAHTAGLGAGCTSTSEALGTECTWQTFTGRTSKVRGFGIANTET